MEESQAEEKKVWLLWVTAIFSNIVVDNLSLALAICCGVASSSISKYMVAIESYDEGQLLRILILMGFVGWTVALFGTALLINAMTPWKAHRLRYILYSYFGWGSALAAIFLVAAVSIVANHDFEKVFAPGFEVANYSKDPTVRTAIDYIQTDFSCCGNTKHTEWFAVPVLGHVSPSVVAIPASCCNTSGACITVAPPEFKRKLTPNRKGCLEAISSYYSSILLIRAAMLAFIGVCEVVVLSILGWQMAHTRRPRPDDETKRLNKKLEHETAGAVLGTAELAEKVRDLSKVSKKAKVKDSQKDRELAVAGRSPSTNQTHLPGQQGSKLKVSAVSSRATSGRTTASNSGWTTRASFGVNESANSIGKTVAMSGMDRRVTRGTDTSVPVSLLNIPVGKGKYRSTSRVPAKTNYGTNLAKR